MNTTRRFSFGASKLWLLWLLATVAAAATLALGLILDADATPGWRATIRTAFLPGATTHGHHQIELKCESCHANAFGGREVLQEACVKCHAGELKEARDSHPRSKFTDPRNAERAARLDATWCMTCHVEHRPQITHAAAVTLPTDYCVICHRDVGKDRPTHVGLAFDGCASSGCHNFHDNRALYEDFLVKHAGKPALLDKALNPERDFVEIVEELASYPLDRYPLQPVSTPDAGGALRTTAKIDAEWLASTHARSGANCSGCHQRQGKGGEAAATWVDKPDHTACAGCHRDEAKTFLAGKHGMRLAAKLGPMQPKLAQAAMKGDAAGRELGCSSCHPAHAFDTRRATTEACLGCHDDTHSRAYEASAHAALWRKELAGEAPAGSGVSCATCHLPRIDHRTEDVKRILVQHNQNDTLRPSDKMLRSACMNCHSLQFALDALADPALVARNFAGRPAVHVRSIEMALEAERRANESRRNAQVSGS